MVSSKKTINYPHSQTYSYLLRGVSGEVIGPAKSMVVNSGDVVDLEVYARFNAATTINSSISTFLTAIVGAFALNPSGGAGIDGPQAYNAFNTTYAAGSLIGSGDVEDQSAPKAFLNYVLFDNNYVMVDFGFDQVTSAGATAHDYLALHVNVKQPGYLYIYLSNENAKVQDVYFDDFKIMHHTKIEQSDDYYPFGLQFNHYERENSTQQNYLFNGGSELQRSLDLGWYQTLFRTYDPAIGRFLQIDPLADFFSGITPYNFAENNPVLYGDPSGLSPTLWERVKAFFGVGRLSGTRAAGNQEYVAPVARSKGKPVPYDFGLPKSPSKPAPQPSPAQPTQQVAEEDEPEDEPAVVYIPQAPILKPRPKPKPQPQPQPQPQPDPKPNPSSFRLPASGSTVQFNAYQFQSLKSDLYSTPANDKLISDLIMVLKSSSNIHLEIRGNVDDDPPGAFENLFSDKAARQQNLMNARSRAIYNALRAAGVSESQLKTVPGSIQSTKGQANQGANMTTTFILTNQ